MTARNVNCLIMVCDGCGQDYGHDFTPHFERTDGEHDWCGKCQLTAHDCAPDPEDSAVCARCGDLVAAVEE